MFVCFGCSPTATTASFWIQSDNHPTVSPLRSLLRCIDGSVFLFPTLTSPAPWRPHSQVGALSLDRLRPRCPSPAIKKAAASKVGSGKTFQIYPWTDSQ